MVSKKESRWYLVCIGRGKHHWLVPTSGMNEEEKVVTLQQILEVDVWNEMRIPTGCELAREVLIT